MESPTKLGALAPPEAGRDAIHVPVAPVYAGEFLEPGWRVSIGADGRAYDDRNNAVGIVDPFLERPVKEGERFWLCLLPGTITALRHVWSHPAFLIKPPSPKEAPSDADAR